MDSGSRSEGIEWLKCLEQRRMKRRQQQQPRSRSKHKKLNVRLQMFVAKRMRLKGCTSLIRKTKRWRKELIILPPFNSHTSRRDIQIEMTQTDSTLSDYRRLHENQKGSKPFEKSFITSKVE